MQLPKRRSQMLSKKDDREGPYYLTAKGVRSLQADLEDLQKTQRPQAVEDVTRAHQLGDLSENADYQEAKFRLTRIDGRIFSIQQRLKRAVLIQHDADGRIHLGSTVLLFVNGHQKTYHLVGPHETRPELGRISHVSPLGSALLNHAAGEQVVVHTPQGTTTYDIVEVR